MERPGIELPAALASHIAAGQVPPDALSLRVIEPGTRRTRAANGW